jgi:hypothetical protein
MTESAGLYSVNMSNLAEFSLATQIIINPRCRCTYHPVRLRVSPWLRARPVRPFSEPVPSVFLLQGYRKVVQVGESFAGDKAAECVDVAVAALSREPKGCYGLRFQPVNATSQFQLFARGIRGAICWFNHGTPVLLRPDQSSAKPLLPNCINQTRYPWQSQGQAI